MNFKKINKTTVRCVLSEDEMHDYGIRLEDFLLNQEKSREFLNLLVDMAGKEVGYHTHSGVMSMQIMRLPNHHLAIIMSESPNPGLDPELLEEHNTNNDEEMENQGFEEMFRNLSDRAVNRIQEELKKYTESTEHLEDAEAPAKKVTYNHRVYCFENFHVLEQLSMVISLEKPITSVLFQEEESKNYFLYVKKGRLKLTDYYALCDKMDEYGVIASEAPYALEYCKEHFECMIPKNALRTIGKISGAYPL